MKLFNDRQRAPRRRVPLTTLALLSLALLLPLTFAGTAQSTPTPVLLGTAGAFAVLAGSGMTNTGVSTIGGDVGSSPTPSQPGFVLCPAADCVALVGANHNDPNPNDAVTQGAKADLITAYNNAAGQMPTQEPTELAGLTLTAGVYNSAAGTFGMSGTLVLDGENNADAIFIFQTASTLITGGTGNVSLIRGAQACNVFWKVGSAATLGAGSTFRGTILAHDDISLGDGVTVEGRLMAAEQGNAGAVTLIHDTITKPTACLTAADVTAATAAANAAAANAAAQAAAAAQATAAAQAAAEQAAAAAQAADVQAAAAAAAKAAAEAQAAATAAAAAKQAADTAAAAAAKVAAAKVAAAKAAAAKAAAAARVARAKATAAKAAATKAAAAKAIAVRLAHVKLARSRSGFTG